MREPKIKSPWSVEFGRYFMFWWPFYGIDYHHINIKMRQQHRSLMKDTLENAQFAQRVDYLWENGENLKHSRTAIGVCVVIHDFYSEQECEDVKEAIIEALVDIHREKVDE